MTLQIGIIGTGWFSRVHADILAAAEDVKVRAFLGTSKEKGERMAAAYGSAGYGDLRDMLDAEQLDAVYVCVPHSFFGGKAAWRRPGTSAPHFIRYSRSRADHLGRVSFPLSIEHGQAEGAAARAEGRHGARPLDGQHAGRILVETAGRIGRPVHRADDACGGPAALYGR
ncbi:Gfo/Idh/MocA family protein [Paenibacillus chibensis]|nr:Gfo/Idh/MocA family oxidoreductase [Paenibacillus chibensis]